MELPVSFQNEMIRILGEVGFRAYREALSESARKGLRVNTLKVRPEELPERFPGELTTIPWTDNGFFYEEALQPAKHPYYYAGLYYLQEPSAMVPASRLPVEPGDRVLDICAAPGGKSTELAAKLAGKGILFSNDISLSRSRALLKNLELFGVKNSVILSEEPSELAKRFPVYFDKILIDAPCSGEGMFRKERKMIRAWEEHGPGFFAPIQRDILEKCAEMLRPGGKLLYSTCTFSALEDEGTVTAFLAGHPEFHLIKPEPYEKFCSGIPALVPNGSQDLTKTLRLFPHCIEGEGHFAALFEKDGEPEESKKKKQNRRRIPKLPQELSDFLDLIGFTDEERSRVRLYGQKAVLLPEGCPDLSGLRTLRTGLLLGECKKNRFEPSQALALALSAGEYPLELRLAASDPRLVRYLKGETLELNEEEASRFGKQMVLVLADRFPVGWGKASGGVLKNKYLPGWRMMS